MRTNFILSVGHELTNKEQAELETWFGSRNVTEANYAGINVKCDIAPKDIEFLENLLGAENVCVLQFSKEAMTKVENLSHSNGFNILDVCELDMTDAIPRNDTTNE